MKFSDPFGLDAFSAFGQAGFSAGTAGATIKIGVGADTDGNMCVTFTTCGRIGAGVSGNLGFGVEHNTANFCEGDSASLGVFGNVGIGLLKSLSVTTSGDNVKTSACVGLGGGLAGGSQTCLTKTICL